jgi:type II secretory pathway pseudopilin PulG
MDKLHMRLANVGSEQWEMPVGEKIKEPAKENAMEEKDQNAQMHQAKRRRLKNREKGFSLIEFLVGSAVTLAAVTISFSLLDQGQTAITTQRARATAQVRARKVLNLMTADIRATGSSPGNFTAGLAPGLLYASANQIRMISDRTGNGTTNQNNEEDANDDVTYIYDSANKTISRHAPNDPAYKGTATILTNEIQSLTIKYYNKMGTELVLPTGGVLDEESRDQVTKMNITAVIEIVEKGKVTGTVTIDNPIAIRNYVIAGY